MTRAARTMVVCGLLAFSPGLSAARAQQADSTRISNEAVFLQVLADGVPMRLKIINGEMARITSSSAIVGLTPKITATGIELHVFEILSGAGVGERIREVEQADIDVATAVRLNTTVMTLEVQLLDSAALPPLPPGWSGTRTDACASPAAPSPTPGAAPGPCIRCCVNCDGVTACACEVWMSCGHCSCNSEAFGPCIG